MTASELRHSLSGVFGLLTLHKIWLKRHQRLVQGLYFYILNQTFNDPTVAHWICRLVPAQCPFERDVMVWGRTFHIPALCKLNPFYESLAMLRFRALSYLSDDCGEDVLIYSQPGVSL